MLRVALGTQNRMYLHTERNTMSFLKASMLQDSIGGFRVGHKALLNVCYIETGKSVYHQYEGGPIWMATAPHDIGQPGQTLTISPKLLTTKEFADNLPAIPMTNEANFAWLPAQSEVRRLLDGDYFRIEAEQWPPVEGVSRFGISLEPVNGLGFAPGLGCYLEARISDFYGRKRKVRFYHDGHSPAWTGLHQGKRYPRVSFLSFDGIRLRIAYGSPVIRVASMYLASPGSLYTVKRTKEKEFPETQNLGWKPSQSYAVGLRRELEREMLRSRHRYPHGRLGTEIAFSIASRELGLGNLILSDPSEGGADMITNDGGIVFENRLVTITEAMNAEMLERQLLFQLGRLKTRLRSDLLFYHRAKLGYAFLSYVNSGEVRTALFEMKK